MKLLLLLLASAMSVFFNPIFSQETTKKSEDPYLIYRSKHIFSIQKVTDEKINKYTQLNTIEYFDATSKEKISITPERFIELFNKGEIDMNLLNIVRDRSIETWYRLGNTDYVLIGLPEEKVTKNYNQTLK